VALAGVLSACAARGLRLPDGPGEPFADGDTLYKTVSRECAGVGSYTAELGLSGRAGSARLRGRLIVGLQKPSAIRLEGVAPFGPPAFILAGDGRESTLLLPRDRRVLRGESPGAIVSALAGVALEPAEMLALLSGCGVPPAAVRAARRYAGDWTAIDVEGATVFVRGGEGAGAIRAARRGSLTIEYLERNGRFPTRMRVRLDGGSTPVDLTLGAAQIETNVDLPVDAFTVGVPDDAEPITLDELREGGPLRGAG
jgi:hypothetical protein